MLKILNGNDNIFNRLVVSKVEIMIEKRIIKPHIVNSGWIEFLIASHNVSLKLETEIKLFWECVLLVNLVKSLSSVFFQFLNIIPTKIEDSKCTNNSL